MKKILVPTDFGVFSKEAIKYAAKLADGFCAELIIFHAFHMEDRNIFGTEKIYGEYLPGYTKWEAQIQMDELCDLIRQNHSNTFPVRGLLQNGFVYEELVKLAKAEAVDFVVMSTNGTQGLSKLFGSTTTSEIVSTLKCPVLVIPPGYVHEIPGEILYACDLHQQDYPLLDTIVSLARFYQAHLAILTVLSNQPLSFRDSGIRELENFSPLKHYSNHSFHLMDAENVVEGIQDFAEFRKAGMIVMASNQRNMIQRIFTASRTKEMAQVTRIPLLALHKSAKAVV